MPHAASPRRTVNGIAAWILAAVAGCGLPQTSLPATAWVGNDGGVVKTDSDWIGTDGCQTRLVDLTRPRGDILLVLDRSALETSSNRTRCSNCSTYWNSLKDAVDILTGNIGDEFRFGLKLFPSVANGNACQVTAALDIPLSDTSSAATRALLQSTTPEGQAPAFLALRSTINYLSALPFEMPQMIVLAMAGLPTCGGAENTQDDSARVMEEIRRANGLAIPVFVLGVADSLYKFDPFGTTGGTGPAYSVYLPEELSMEMQILAMQNAPCSFALPVAPNQRPAVQVTFDGQTVMGFGYGADGASIELNNEACDELRSLTVSEVRIQVGCI